MNRKLLTIEWKEQDSYLTTYKPMEGAGEVCLQVNIKAGKFFP
jgi:hypothetical protein